MMNLNLKQFPILETERLQLRCLIDNDAKALFRLRSDEKVMRFMDRPPFTSEDQAIEVIRKDHAGFDAGDNINWAISFKTAPEMIGYVGFWRLFKEHYRAEVGYALSPDFWGTGIMNEALVKIIEFAFKSCQFHSIEGNVSPSNLASIHLLEKVGFRREAHFRENFFFNGKFLDSYIYSLLERDFNRVLPAVKVR